MPESNGRSIAVAILAAGQGKRMNNPDQSKVMALLDGKPLIAHVLDETNLLNPVSIVLIVGHQRQSVIDFIRSEYSNKILFAEQNQQLGTGHAVAQTKGHLIAFQGDILILSGDVPLLSAKTLNKFIENHNFGNWDLSVLSTIAPDPNGYGRIVRDNLGNFLKIVEQKDADEFEQKIHEINSGVYLVKSDLLFDALDGLSNDNSQGEYYLTDIIEIAYNKSYKVNCFAGAEFGELQGINSPQDLAKAEEYYHRVKNKVI
jgi:UDP-N-acetylglucosamine diphosphorylase/glucosamine-1-phosphate N-acetyltransferase